MAKILYFDCFSGISGDMTLGALLDLGVDQAQLFQQLNSLRIEGYTVSVSKKQVQGISGTDFAVQLTHHHDHSHRHLAEIEKIIEQGQIAPQAKKLATKIFHTIARAEAKIHGKEINQIHFHEVGAIDSIVDIVGTSICLSLLQPDKIVSSPLHLGSGSVTCDHGVLPVPAPATAEILAEIPVYSTGVQGELVTPTGAAIIKTIANDFINLPAMVIKKTAYGCGKKSYNIPNLLRVFWGEDHPSQESTEELILLETNIDDMNPEIYSFLLPLLLKKGALDAYLTGIIMKKGRPGNILSVLCEPSKAIYFEEILFRETTTLGIRKSSFRRNCLERRIETVTTEFGPVRIKQAFREGKLIKMAPEFEDCRQLAEEKDLALKEVFNLALEAAKKIYGVS